MNRNVRSECGEQKTKLHERARKMRLDEKLRLLGN